MATYFHVRRIGGLNASDFVEVGEVLQFEGANNYSRYLWEESLAASGTRVTFPLGVIEKLPEIGQHQLRAAMNSRLCKQVVEYVFEAVRIRHYPIHPSRKTCIFAGKSLEQAVSWMRNFGQCDRYQILEIEPDPAALLFDGDANLVCYDTPPLNLIETCAHHYWKGSKTPQLLEETLIQGAATVLRIVESKEE